RDVRILTNCQGNPSTSNGKPIAQFDVKDNRRGYSDITVQGLAYYLGNETGVTHSWVDSTAVNGQDYYYAVTAYDYGSPDNVPDSLAFYPSENAIAVSRTPRGGLILPKNVIHVRAEPRVSGYVGASLGPVTKVAGRGTGVVTASVIH